VFWIGVMCGVLGVSVSGYYAWRKRPVSRREEANQALVQRIRRLYHRSHQTYGSPRLWAELRAEGEQCSLNRVARLMRLHHIGARRPRRYTVTTQSQHQYPVAPNVLGRDFTASAPNQKWVADITYVPTQEGWLYLATLMDLFSRKIIGWAMDKSLATDLTCQALRMALATRQPIVGLLHHSDRGSQYASQAYQSLLQARGVQVSMSRSGNCYDNAAMESLFGTIKAELIHHQTYRTRQEAKTAIFAYIETFYNRHRRHSTLGYLSPDQYEQNHVLSC
jgi:putative transposase